MLIYDVLPDDNKFIQQFDERFNNFLSELKKIITPSPDNLGGRRAIDLPENAASEKTLIDIRNLLKSLNLPSTPPIPTTLTGEPTPGSPEAILDEILTLLEKYLDVKLSDGFDQITGDPAKTLADLYGQLDINLTALGNLIRGASTKDLTTLSTLIGEVQISPTQYTLLERLKVLDTLLTAIKSTDGIKKITDAVTMIHGKTCKPKTVTISSNATTEIVPAVADKLIKVYYWLILTDSTDQVTLQFKTGTSTTNMPCPFFQTGAGFITGIAPGPTIPPTFIFKTNTISQALNVTTSGLTAGKKVTITIGYWDDDAT